MTKTNAIRILQSQKIPFDLITYTYDANNLNVADIANNNNLPVAQVFKTLVAKGNKTGIVVALVSGDKSLNFKLLAKASGNKKITLVAVKDLLALTGYIRGGCSPLGMKKQFPVFIDKAALAFDTIYVNAGKRGILIGIEPEQLAGVCLGTFVEIVD